MGFRVLVVDDASFIRDTIKRNLRPLIPDAEIFEAADGRKAMSAMRSKKIQLILSDWEMPEMSGEDFLKWLRSEEDYQEIPFIMVTSRGDRDHVITAVKAGVSDYLTKPFTPEELHKKVSKQLRRIGYKPPKRGGPSVVQDGESALSVLTGGQRKPAPAKAPVVREAEGFAKTPAKPAAKVASTGGKSKSHFKGTAYVRFASGKCECEVRELSLQAMNGVMARMEKMPTVFEPAAVDLINPQGEVMARLNAYVHAVLASDPRPESPKVKITIRFVDNDPSKFEALSKAIAGV